jgi:prophage regulatory protein
MKQHLTEQQAKKLSTLLSQYEVEEYNGESYISFSTSMEAMQALNNEISKLKSPPKRVIRVPEVLNRIGTSRTHLYRLIKANKFPAPVKLSEKLIGFYEHEVEEYLTALSTQGGK